jgi:4-hydroxy-3-polyprenylbenzoate decarboxylase
MSVFHEGKPSRKRRIIMALTGASGAVIGLRLLAQLADKGVQVHLMVSDHGRRVLADECDLVEARIPACLLEGRSNVTYHDNRALDAPVSSGSFLTDGMVICPCSSHTLGAVAAGLGDYLITRAAHVTLKERRPLVLVHREMPVSTIDLRNMLALSQAGATICPASPGFYMKPRSTDDLVDFVAGRVMDILGVDHELDLRWTQPE